jgi:hypothetical protein
VLETIIQSAAILVPLGVSPLLSIALFGALSSLGIYAPPAGFEPFTQPLVWVSALLLGGFIKLGKSAKVTKPIAEAIGSFESIFALVVSVLVMLPCFFHESGGFEAALVGVPLIALALSAALLATLTIVTLRTALDVLAWLTPFPFVDLAFQIFKLFAIAALVALAVFAPTAAIAVDALVLLGAALFIRWSLRTARFGLSTLYDLTLGRLNEKAKLPRDAIMPEDLGPFHVFALEIPGVARRAKVEIVLEAGRWFASTPRRRKKGARAALGDAEKAAFEPGLLGTTMVLPGGKVLFPPRYAHLMADLRVKTGSNAAPNPDRQQINSTVRRTVQRLPTAS